MVKWFPIVLLLAFTACEEESTFIAGAISQPVDFAFACEGDGQTIAPQDDQTAAAYDATRMCSDIAKGVTTGQGSLFGLVLSQSPARIHLVQMNPASGNEVAVLDANRFVPGYTGLQVGEAPIRILRDSNYGAFYVLNAGSKDISRIVIRSFQGQVDVAQATFPLPGTPADGTIIDGKLFVTSAFQSEAWLLDTQAMDQGAQVIPLPDRVHSIVPVDGTTLALTWKSRPVLSLMDSSGQLDAEGEQGLVPACRDTLDNDGDGKKDHEDTGCSGGVDTSEAGDVEASTPLEPLTAFMSDLYCDDGIDNDGDGHVDGDDPSCANNGVGERSAECEDGIDNDGDGKTDLDDEACYAGSDLNEGHVYGDGPFLATLVDSKAAGRFMYVMDQSQGQLIVFEWTENGLVRIDVNAVGATAEELVYRAYGSESTTSLPALTNDGFPALSHREEKNLVLPGTNLTSLTGFHGVGELWERGIAVKDGDSVASIPEGQSASTHWIPAGCDPSNQEACLQPVGDGDNHFVVGSRLDGGLQMIQAVFRGVPRHRFVQLSNDPSLRTMAVSQPKLTVGSTSYAVGSSIPEDHPFMGPMLSESIQTALAGVQPALKRQYGVWPPENPEQAPDETWALTYEGVVPGTEGYGGRLVEDGMFHAPGQRFCSRGVQIGDVLVIESSAQNMAAGLHDSIAVSFDGETCPLKVATLSRVQVAITLVGEDVVEVDAENAKIVPQAPVLDETDLGITRLKGCRDAVEAAVKDLGLDVGDYGLSATDAFVAANLPDRVTYRVRAGGAWVVQGTQSGFVHRNVFADGQCGLDPNASERLHSRIQEATLINGNYTTCPPSSSELTVDSVDTLVSSDSRFENFSFKTYMFPSCRNTEQGVVLPGTRRDTRWTFSLNGMDTPTTIQVEGTTHSARSVPFDFRRQLIHLGTSGNRVTLLRVSPTSTVPISKFE
jgi:hypothetical protein